jgi:hypothetical protein
MARARRQPQTSIYETVVEDEKVEKALEERATLAAKKSIAVSAYADKDEEAKGLLAALDLGDGAPVRIGRFVIERKTSAPAAVSFERKGGSRFSIKTVPEGS